MSLMPAVPVAVGLVCGIALRQYTASLWWPLCAAAAVMLFFLCSRHIAGFACFVSACGWVLANFAYVPHAEAYHLPEDETYFVGVVEDVREHPATRNIRVDVIAHGVSPVSLSACDRFSASVGIPSLDPVINSCDTIVARGMMIEIPRPAYMPSVSEYEQYLASAGISARCASAELLQIKPGMSKSSEPLRRKVAMCLLDSHLQYESAALVAALIAGDDSLVPENISTDYRYAGMAHLLALSGMHVGILLMIIALLLLPVRLWVSRRIYIIVAVALLWLYAVFTGMSVSVVRATVMATVLLGARLLDRRYSALNALAVAAIVILLADPMALSEIGFQLSFAAVGSVIIFMPRVNELCDSRRLGSWLPVVQVAALSAAAFIGTLPILVYHFGYVSVYSILTALPVCILMPLILCSGALYTMFLVCGVHWNWLGSVVDNLCSMLSGLASAVASVPYSSITVPAIGSVWFVLLWGMVLILLWFALLKRSMLTTACALCLLAGVLMLPQAFNAPCDEVYVVEGLAYPRILVSTRMRCRLVSADTPDSVGECRRLESYMRARGIDSLGFSKTLSCLAASRVFRIVTSGRRLTPCKVDYALVGASTTAHPAATLAALRPDTVVLSAMVAPVKRRDWIQACAEAGAYVVDLRSATVHICQ